MRRTGAIAVAVVVLATLLACGKKAQNPDGTPAPKPEPTRLFAPAMSYWSFEQAKKSMGYNTWDVLEDRNPLVSDRRPPFRIVTNKVPNYKDHGYSGDLVLSFYNDRLMKTQYYVLDMKDYLTVASADQQIALGTEGSGGIAPHTKVWLGKDADGKTYIGMEDEILKGQMDDWIVKYSLN